MRSALAAALLLAVCPASADDVSPGLWEITLETRVPADAGFAPTPFKLTQCLTAQDARDPARVLAGVSSPGASGCDYTDRSYAGNSFSFSMQCAGSLGIQSSGRVAFTPDTMDGNITATANLDGKPVQTESRISARRLGGC
jgi:hypothetical protein